jgi:hypothetical protein
MRHNFLTTDTFRFLSVAKLKYRVWSFRTLKNNSESGRSLAPGVSSPFKPLTFSKRGMHIYSSAGSTPYPLSSVVCLSDTGIVAHKLQFSNRTSDPNGQLLRSDSEPPNFSRDTINVSVLLMYVRNYQHPTLCATGLSDRQLTIHPPDSFIAPSRFPLNLQLQCNATEWRTMCR